MCAHIDKTINTLHSSRFYETMTLNALKGTRCTNRASLLPPPAPSSARLEQQPNICIISAARLSLACRAFPKQTLEKKLRCAPPAHHEETDNRTRPGWSTKTCLIPLLSRHVKRWKSQLSEHPQHLHVQGRDARPRQLFQQQNQHHHRRNSTRRQQLYSGAQRLTRFSLKVAS